MGSEAATVACIVGSLRAGSFNRMLLETAREEAASLDLGLELKPFDIAAVPLFNADVEAEGDPEPVVELKAAIAGADALFIVTPEYQHGIPGVLKNALDWASRPADKSVLEGKLVAIAGASPSPVGTARGQLQLRQTLLYNDCRVIARPEVAVSRAPEKFKDGRLVDEFGLDRLRQLLRELDRRARDGH